MIYNDVSLDYVDPELIWTTNPNSVQKSITADGLITPQATYVSSAYEFLYASLTETHTTKPLLNLHLRCFPSTNSAKTI
ncbi:hypothetical protein [Paenibacillus jilunlii]|uniref:hypothetical protein n=1 Tax=Paenibacillus jilunlii TaxID=682956 RepID=UPI00142F37F5|nr:hypothetical protein [Paenibacillus jilunlii]